MHFFKNFAQIIKKVVPAGSSKKLDSGPGDGRILFLWRKYVKFKLIQAKKEPNFNCN